MWIRRAEDAPERLRQIRPQHGQMQLGKRRASAKRLVPGAFRAPRGDPARQRGAVRAAPGAFVMA